MWLFCMLAYALPLLDIVCFYQKVHNAWAYSLHYLQNYREIHMHSTTFWTIWCSHTCCQTAKRRPLQIYNLVPVAPAEDTGYASPVDVGVVFAVKITQSALSVGSEQERQIGRCTVRLQPLYACHDELIHSTQRQLSYRWRTTHGRVSVCLSVGSSAHTLSSAAELWNGPVHGRAALRHCADTLPAHTTAGMHYSSNVAPAAAPVNHFTSRSSSFWTS